MLLGMVREDRSKGNERRQEVAVSRRTNGRPGQDAFVGCFFRNQLPTGTRGERARLVACWVLSGERNKEKRRWEKREEQDLKLSGKKKKKQSPARKLAKVLFVGNGVNQPQL